MKLNRFLLSGTALATLVLMQLPGMAFASDLPSKAFATVPPLDLPAVDGFNAKIVPFGGASALADRNNKLRGAFGVEGAVSIPLGHSFGLQVDGVASSLDGSFLGGGAAHLFWRDPRKALFGLYASGVYYDKFGGATSGRLGAEGAVFFDRFTIEGIAGVEGGHGNTQLIGGFNQTFSVKTRFFDLIDIVFYPVDNLRLFVGHRYAGGRNAAAAGAEYNFGLSGGTTAAAFIEGRAGERNYKAVWAGVKFYFGQKPKTLIQRHREDDPEIRLRDDLFTITNSFKKTLVVPPPPPPPPPPPTCPFGGTYPACYLG